MVSFPSGSISGTINNSVYINCCGSNIDLNQPITPTQVRLSLETSIGSNVVLSVPKRQPSDIGISLNFGSVVGSGVTTIVTINPNSSTPNLPDNFVVGDSVASFSISSTANFSGEIVLDFYLPENISQEIFNSCRVFRVSNGQTTNPTILNGPKAPDFSTKRISALVNGFSDFHIIPPKIPSCNWNGVAPFDNPCNGIRTNVNFTFLGNYTWNYIFPLTCGEGSYIEGRIHCNKDVILTEFNQSTCLSKWTPWISSSCGNALLTGTNDGNCTNDKPPLFYYTMDFTGCPDPQKCCPTCCRFEGYNLQDWRCTYMSKEACDTQTYDWGNGYIEANGHWIPRSECNQNTPGICQHLINLGYFTNGGQRFCFQFNDINNTRQNMRFISGGGIMSYDIGNGYILLQQQCGRWRLDMSYPTYGGHYAVAHQFLDHEGACFPILPGVWQITEGVCP